MKSPEDVNILIVDDKEDNLYSIKILLEEDQYKFFLASSGEEALKLALRHDISIILLDVQMPGMDGYEVASILKKNSKTKNIPLIFLTAIDYDIDNVLKGFHAGAIDFIFKPVNPEILRAKVSTFAELFRAQNALSKLNDELEENVIERTRQLEQRNNELEKMNKVLDNFLHVTAHDFRAPLSNISLLIDLLKHEDNRSIPKDQIVKNLDITVHQIDRTIKGIVEMIEVQEKKHIPAKKIHFSTVLKKIRDEFNSELEDLDVMITSDFLKAETLIYNPVYLENIFRILINNCIKHRSPEKNLTVNISSAPEKEYILLEVTDNGMGIDMKKHEKTLFHPFYRINKNADGKGIGLHLLKNMVEMNEGKIKVTSSPGLGTSFFIYLKNYL